MPREELMRRERIAVLGGGAGALFTVLALTDQADWADRFEIDVYTLGWRLGGKGASSRDPATGRNTEHGLHVLGGFYHNSFRWLRALYREWAVVDPARALAFDDAFVPQRHCDLMEGGPGTGRPWRAVRMDFADDGRQPGVDPEDPDLPQLMRRMVEAVCDLVPGLESQAGRAGMAVSMAARLLGGLREAILALLGRHDGPDTPGPVDDAIALAVAASFVPLRELSLALMGKVRPRGREPDRAALVATGCVVVIGWLRDRLYRGDFAALDGEELADWMRRHGASEALLAQPYFRAGYDYLFAYEGGVTEPPARSLSAAVAMRWFPRMLLCYHGALFWHMHGGMGEVVFAPLHDVLKARGVRFHFFRRVTAIEADDAGVAAVTMAVQAAPAGEYEPMFDWRGRRTWPARPLYGQLVDGDRLRAENDDFECAWAPDRGVPAMRLERGRDFDRVVLAISVGALGAVAAPLAAASPAFGACLKGARTTPAAGAQIWATAAAPALGVEAGRLTTAYAQPFATAADMSFLLPLEGGAERHLLYLCGTLGPVACADDRPGSCYPGEQEAFVKTRVAAWVASAVRTLLPGAPAGYGADLVVRANVRPSDHYVLSPPGTLKHRLPPGSSGFANLVLAGDWTLNGLDAGSFEAAVMSGLLAARAISGRDVPVWGGP